MSAPLILLVDDNEDSRVSMKAALRKSNYSFLEATNGEEGIFIAEKYLPDLIIMDVMMPGINGYEALKNIKTKECTKHIPVLVVTALSSMDEKIIALEFGAEGLWSKPFDRSSFIEQVETLVGIYHKSQTKTSPKIEKEKLDKVLHRQNEELIQYYYTDVLTTLPNRSQLIKDIKAIPSAAILLIDIDRFKDIVYFYGHDIGDMYLKTFAQNLRNILNSHNYKHYRISGDIFAVLIQECDADKELESIIDIFTLQMEECLFRYNTNEIHFRITVGGSTFQEDLLISAEKALKSAKEMNTSKVLYHQTSEQFRSYEQNIFWINIIDEAIANNRIIPFFQPIKNNQNGKIEKYESLVRIIDKNNTIHPPIKFLDIAKKCRKYPDITKNVIEKSFERFKESDYQFSINLSAKDMIDDKTAQQIYKQLESFDECHRVIFELLESEGIENYDKVYEFIKTVKEYGCQIAIDDFGSGYSNFIHLVRLKVDIIKIDGSLIRDLDSDENALLIVKSIIDFAKKLNIKTVAEFVHSDVIETIVRELEIDYSQGYQIGIPEREILR